LKFDAFVGDEFFQELGGFVVQAMELWMEAALLEETKNVFVHSFD
jgi:hypothetical protein